MPDCRHAGEHSSRTRARCVIDPVTVVVEILVGLAIIVGVLGIVIPVLPGSFLIAAAVGVWAIITGGASWWVFAGVAVLIAIGSVSTYLLNAKASREFGVPARSLIGAAVLGIVGFFVVPVVGLVLGFALGLLGMEYLRLRDWTRARQSAVNSLKATGKGMLIELGCALFAAALWLAAVLFWV